MKTIIQIKFYTKFGQNTTFHILEKKKEVKRSHFFPFFETQNRCLTENFSCVEKYNEFFSLIFGIIFLNHVAKNEKNIKKK